MRYWLYKNNRDGGPAMYWGDWQRQVFRYKRAQQWGGHYSTRSAEVAQLLNDEVAEGDVVAAYQTDDRVVVGFLRVERISGPRDSKKLYLRPIHRLDQPLAIHDRKAGTVLAYSKAVNGPVMLRELDTAEMRQLTKLSGAPERVLRGQEPPGGYRANGGQQPK